MKQTHGKLRLINRSFIRDREIIFYDDDILDINDNLQCYSTKNGYHFSKISDDLNYLFLRKNNRIKSTLEEQCKTYEEGATILKKATENSEYKINLFRMNIKTCFSEIFNYFYEKNKLNYTFDKITSEEAEFIFGCRRGGLIYNPPKKIYKGKTFYKYDISSCYYYILQRNQSGINCPIKEGKFKKLTQEEFANMKYYSIGIYKCKCISDDVNYKIFSSKNYGEPIEYYTHIDLNFGKNELGYKFVIDEEVKFNFLDYKEENQLIQTSTLMKDVINFLYPLKSYHKYIVKSLLCWGFLTQKNKTRKYHISEVIDRNLIEDIDINDRCLLKQVTPFMYPYGRILPFIIAKGKVLIAEKIIQELNNGNNIICCKTDGFLAEKQIENHNESLGEKLIGKLMFEKEVIIEE